MVKKLRAKKWMGCQPQDVSTSAVAIERNEDLTSSQKYDAYVNVDRESIQSLKTAVVLVKKDNDTQGYLQTHTLTWIEHPYNLLKAPIY